VRSFQNIITTMAKRKWMSSRQQQYGWAKRKRYTRSYNRKWGRTKSAYGPIQKNITRLEVPYENVALGGMETRKLVHLRYAEVITLDSSASTSSVYTFTANGMYDPNITSTGHQPQGFDELMNFFNHYTVIDSTIRVCHAPTSTSNLTPGMLDVLLSDRDSVTIANGLQLMETREGTGLAIYTGPAVQVTGQPKFITRRFNAKKFFGVKTIIGESEYRGDTTKNPDEQAYFHVVQCSSGGNDPNTAVYNVVIDYLAVLTEPKAIGFS